MGKLNYLNRKNHKATNKKRALIAWLCGLITAAAAFSTTSSRRIRRFGVRPLNRGRQNYGQYKTLFKFMQTNDEDQFFKYTRLTIQQFQDLLRLIEHRLRKTTKMDHIQHIFPEERLAVTLHYLAEGCSQQEMAWSYLMGKTTVHKIVTETCRIIWEELCEVYLKQPSLNEWANIAEGFMEQWNLPNCIGAVDGKHVNIQAPKNSGSHFFNYKKTFSIVLMAACDSNYNFTMIDIGASGANHDGFVFRESGFGSRLLNGSLRIPGHTALPKSEKCLEHFLVGDAAFPLHKNIMRPYPGENLSENEKIFNYRLSRARRTIENTFGILAQRWRILRRTIIADIENCEAFVKAVVVLHNYIKKSEVNSVQKRYSTGIADLLRENGDFKEGSFRNEPTLASVGRLGSNNFKKTTKQARDELALWTANEGAVPWQLTKIYEGAVP